jgi:hypothetical protein
MTMMAKVMHSGRMRSSKIRKEVNAQRSDDFTPCSQDMTICGDCEGNRAKKKCPRLKEWLAKRER